ncbi:APC family permease [Alicyclobacillus ferrooxydans]|uniref:Amino acid permease n=1 Tax=Alicyclobacillus ferrooxydans TaxID=471514 RepID=A0A0P9GTD4_9BACL|nr:APC family permease [Alicyclobacillus ferrooxydans]KPV44428.1 amino acid permease [Alicyclobacillus ferrooxydans]
MNEDRLLKRRLGFWSLTAASLGGVIGSGWLFGAMYAAKAAGPESIITWIVGGIAMLLVGLVFAELGMAKPEAGGLVRYPKLTNGSMVGSLIGFAIWLGFVANPPTEASGVVQYASRFWPGLYNGNTLTGRGIAVAIVLMLIFVLVNYFGVNVFAKVNNVVTGIKFVVPVITIVTLLVAGFHPSNFSGHGGFAPYGWGSGLSAIATAGIVFAYTGFRNSIDLSAEAVNPRRNVPMAIVATIVIAIVLYILLEIAFMGAVPTKDLIHGWQGVSFNSPFADLAFSLNLTWLYWILMVDAMVSPSGSSFSYTAGNARNVYGLAKNRFFPRYFAKIHPKFGVPTRALILNFIVGLLYLVPLKSWHSIIALTSALAVYTFSAGAVSVMVFRKVGISDKYRIRGMNVIAPLAFVVGSLIIYWDKWSELQFTIWVLVLGLILYLITYVFNKEKGPEIRGGIWMVIYLFVVLLLAGLGNFGGAELIPEPYMSIIVAIASLILYFIGVQSGVWYMRKVGNVEEIRRENEEMDEG